MRGLAIIVVLLHLPLFACVSEAQASPESDAFAFFEEACLRDEAQFDTVMTLARDRHLPVAPPALRDSIVQKGEGAAWLAQTAPFMLLHANMDAGCGLMLKPASDAGFQTIVEALPGIELASHDEFETSWSRWYVLEHGNTRGILMTGLMDVSESKSAFLRYIPASFVVEHAESMLFLLTDVKRFRELRLRLTHK